MRQILAMVGLPARITSDPGDGQTFGRLRVVSAAKQRTSTTEAASLEIPVGSPWDRPGDVRVAWIDSIPVLYLGPLGKPAQVIDKIVEGKLESFYRSAVLMDQPTIRDGSVTVSQVVAQTAAKVGEHVTVSRFARFKVGEAEA